MQSVCERRGLRCRLNVKNEAAAVESDPEVVQVRGAGVRRSLLGMAGNGELFRKNREQLVLVLPVL